MIRTKKIFDPKKNLIYRKFLNEIFFKHNGGKNGFSKIFIKISRFFLDFFFRTKKIWGKNICSLEKNIFDVDLIYPERVRGLTRGESP